MKPNEINIAIAEHLGWTRTPCEFDNAFAWRDPQGEPQGRYYHPEAPDALPNYSGDLNAMHEAFKHLGRHWEIAQVNDGYLCRIQFGPRGRDVVAAGLELLPVMAEAFLRIFRKWKDTE